MIKQALKIESAANKPGHEVAGTLTSKQVKDVAEKKAPDLTAAKIDGGMRTVEGSARSMGIKLDYK